MYVDICLYFKNSQKQQFNKKNIYVSPPNKQYYKIKSKIQKKTQYFSMKNLFKNKINNTFDFDQSKFKKRQ